jgi:tetratricopeptide (TPR) repeat protein
MLHLSARLIKVADGGSLWGQQFDRDVKEIFQVRSEIVHGIAGALSIELSPSERKTLARIPTSNLDAYDYYLKGCIAFDQCTSDGNKQAEKMFRKAVGLDKNYALAQIGLAQTYLQRIEWDIDPDPKWIDEAAPLLDKASAIDSTQADLHLGYATLHRLRGAAPKSITAARRAVALRPNDHESHFSLAVSLYNGQKWEEADREFARTLDLRPDFAEPHRYRARMAAFSGKPVEADSQLQKALELAPRAAHLHLDAARQLLRRGHFAEAESEARKAIELAPQILSHTGFLGTVELWQRKLDEAIDHLKEAADQLQSAALYRQLGWVYRVSGKKGPAEKAFRNTLRLNKEKLDLDSTSTSLAYQVLIDQCLLDPAFAYEPELNRLAKKALRSYDPSERAYETAVIYCAAGKSDRAIASLREALKYNVYSPAYVASDPAFAAIESNTKFRELVRQK